MTLRILVGFIVTCAIFLKAGSSLVKLENGGYEDVVIAINPNIKEDVKIITKIQDMVNEATTYLFYATKKRLFIRSVKILIPPSWPNRNYTKSKTETYDKADIIIAKPYLKYRDDPYTLQYGRCGEPGRYIHLTPNFLLDDNLISVYGPRGRVFVHEWAHLRWGVYDEYNTDVPYYIARNGNIEATRCSKNIRGVNVKRTDENKSCKGSSCQIKYCLFDRKMGLYEDGCVFVPEKDQNVKQSIMYSQSIPSVTEFCDSSNHNIEAPTLQNKMCNSLSTWEVIMNSTDIASTPPMTSTNIPVPTFTLIQKRDRVVTLVLDVSGSMDIGYRIDRLYQAAGVFVTQIIETGSSVGIVTFSDDAYEISQLVKIISDVQRNFLKSLLPTTTVSGTNICKGILAGFEVNKKFDGSTDGTEIILLTDGEDNFNTRLCFPNIIDSGAIINFIALGPSASKALEDIAEMTGGLNYKATDNLDTNGLIDAFNGIQPLTGDISLQLESIGSTVQPSKCMNGSVVIDSTVGNDTFFLVTWRTAVPNIVLQDPNGLLYTAAHFSSDSTSKSSRLEIPGMAQRGMWWYSLCNTFLTSQEISIIVNSKAADENVQPITVQAHMNAVRNSYPNPMIVYASVTQGLLPVTGVNVTAIIEPNLGNVIYLDLLDNGAGADVSKNDGIYSKYFISFTVNGRYSLKVRVEGKDGSSRLAPPTSRALYVPGYVENGAVVLNDPNPGENDTALPVNVGDFTRTSLGGSFVISDVPSDPSPDIFPPEKISDLKAQIEDDRIVLSWTATGDDLDQGAASSYDLRMSNDPKELLDKFSTSLPVNISNLTPQVAGSTETISFVPENVAMQNGTILYFALSAVDKASQASSPSNIAQAALVIPNVDTSTSETTTASPDTTIASPDTTTASPDTTIASPDTTTASPDTTTASPDTTTASPDATIASPDTTTASPDTTIASPDTTTASPDTTTASPDATIASPDTTTASPDATIASPDTTTASPDTTIASPDTTTASPDTTTASPNTTTASPDTTTASPNTTTVTTTTRSATTTARRTTKSASADVIKIPLVFVLTCYYLSLQLSQ
ncbi:calcium-activated chloride channel regulator 1-like [Dendrobates tinctorius]|uniref:calcium-activated chloride channel regulator 1-like n=1 Tax=Dendrobates tinctorius TaxID=92724 RepID=UPI003CC9BF94